jgi:hypothetical protein
MALNYDEDRYGGAWSHTQGCAMYASTSGSSMKRGRSIPHCVNETDTCSLQRERLLVPSAKTNTSNTLKKYDTHYSLAEHVIPLPYMLFLLVDHTWHQ